MHARDVTGIGLAIVLAGAGFAACERTPAAEVPATAGAGPPVVPAGTPAAASLPRPPMAGFVDEAACAGCHRALAEAWRGSDHDLAMQETNADTVLGDFADARFTDASTDTRFLRDEHGWAVETEGSDGERGLFRVPYVFGVDPLQQVLLSLPQGRLQALSVAWDARAKRWYSLYPDERILAHDPLHWTRPAQNWNFSCAECHATGLVRGYDPEADAFATRWHRLDVGCQACHGPGERHVAWAVEGADEETSGRGFEVTLRGPDSTVEIETCARCHARRAPLGDGHDPRDRFLDHYRPALLTEGLYYADGQIQDEVYEYGSFLQSRMFARGVRCSDCHDPHSSRIRAEGNLLCTSCHSPTPVARPHVDLARLVRKNYDSEAHHHHEPGTPGSACVDCHMAPRTYMGIDARRDHGFRVPRPDLAGLTGAPDACTGCHQEHDARWAAAEIAGWTGPVKRPPPFGVALGAARAGRAGAADGLLALARSEETPIVRATALHELRRYPSQAALAAFEAGLADPDGLVRLAALEAFEDLPAPARVAAVTPRLADPLRAVRAEAGRLLAGLGARELGPNAEAAVRALAEYETIQRSLLERPEARLNLAQLARERGEVTAAEGELAIALRLEPAFVPARVNLADVVRLRSEEEAEALLRAGIRATPDAAALHHALGLGLVRQGRAQQGLESLARAAALDESVPRFAYVHAIALHDGDRPEEARTVLARLLERHPGDRDARFALAAFLAEAGDAAGAERCLAGLAAINPHDPELPADPPGAARGR